ncbi:alpha/beta hydrolase [Pseudomonas sp. 5P_3.1_Bac2]|uniref:alpha/beta hydrolase n=1 Tax=Pseudomonas sp. 5P_3.1_Bac2 TaxID=2971617 RepID=UPI0021CA43CB|nr:alpha/beta hydrolase [Pseudomonas sp. 5P_3.1_Bac2]MCU1715681.1 alpha/beta hydrolase [Pseudomonas sp. 5P_3.1_Bac2]
MNADLIFIHGMWSRQQVWQDWISSLRSQGFNCLSLDLPGHAPEDSDEALAGMPLQRYVDAVVKLARTCQRPVLIGHSLGGLLAQLAAQHVEVSALVLINSAVPGQIFPLRPVMLPGLLRPFAQWGLWRKSFRLTPWEANYLVFNQVPASQRPALYEQLIAESGRVAYAVGYGPLNTAGSNRVDLNRLHCPILALAGGRDRIIPPGVSRKMAQLYGARMDYREFPRHAHWLLGEAGWQDHVQQVSNWLRLQLAPLA